MSANQAGFIEDITTIEPSVFVLPSPQHGFTTPPQRGAGTAIYISPTHQSARGRVELCKFMIRDFNPRASLLVATRGQQGKFIVL
jgi:hypothetical protein